MTKGEVKAGKTRGGRHGGARPGSGMPKGYKTRKTLAKEEAREFARQKIFAEEEARELARRITTRKPIQGYELVVTLIEQLQQLKDACQSSPKILPAPEAYRIFDF